LPRTYMRGELLSQPVPRLPPPRAGRKTHVYCDPRNSGATDLIREVSQQLDLPITYAADASKLHECECMLLYLTAKTWTGGRVATRQLAHVLRRALGLRVRVVLAHEMIGLGQDGRHPCEFEKFFSCANGDTPKFLIQAGLYRTVAVPLKGGAWRPVSLRLLAKALAEPPTGRPPSGVLLRAEVGSSPTPPQGHVEVPGLVRDKSSGDLTALASRAAQVASSRVSQSVKLTVMRGESRRSHAARASASSRRSDQQASVLARKLSRSGSTEAPPPLSRRSRSACSAELPTRQSLQDGRESGFHGIDEATSSKGPSDWPNNVDDVSGRGQPPHAEARNVPSSTTMNPADLDCEGENIDSCTTAYQRRYMPGVIVRV